METGALDEGDAADEADEAEAETDDADREVLDEVDKLDGASDEDDDEAAFDALDDKDADFDADVEETDADCEAEAVVEALTEELWPGKGMFAPSSVDRYSAIVFHCPQFCAVLPGQGLLQNCEGALIDVEFSELPHQHSTPSQLALRYNI